MEGYSESDQDDSVTVENRRLRAERDEANKERDLVIAELARAISGITGKADPCEGVKALGSGQYLADAATALRADNSRLRGLLARCSPMIDIASGYLFYGHWKSDAEAALVKKQLSDLYRDIESALAERGEGEQQ